MLNNDNNNQPNNSKKGRGIVLSGQAAFHPKNVYIYKDKNREFWWLFSELIVLYRL